MQRKEIAVSCLNPTLVIASVVEACVASQEMVHSIIESDPTLFDVTELVYGSPLPLEDKVRLFGMLRSLESWQGRTQSPTAREEALCCYASAFPKVRALSPSVRETVIEFGLGRAPSYQLAAHREAIGELASVAEGDLFCLHQYWPADDPLDETDEMFVGVFPSCRDAIEWLARDRAEEGGGDDDSGAGAYLEKWHRTNTTDGSAAFENPYTYYLVGDKVCYARHNHLEDEPSLWWMHDRTPFGDLDVRAPFAAGDLIEFSLEPLSKSTRAAVVEPEREDATDCCYPQVLYRDRGGRLQVAALKHLCGGMARAIGFSPLYTARRIAEPASVCEPVLLEVSDHLRGDAGKGARLWEALNDEQMTSASGCIDESALQRALASI